MIWSDTLSPVPSASGHNIGGVGGASRRRQQRKNPTVILIIMIILLIASATFYFTLLFTHPSAACNNDGAKYLARTGRRLNDQPYKPIMLDSLHPEKVLVAQDEQAYLFRPNVPVDYYHPGRLNLPTGKVALGQLQDLKNLNLTFIIIVFGWKRRTSLQRLCNSLTQAEYHGFRVKINFHIDGGAHPRVLEYVDNFNWPHGNIQITRQASRIGLESIVVGAWEPPSTDDQFAMFFEDDIEVSPHYFTYTLLSLRKYLFPDGKYRSRTYHADHLIGISYNTPRYNEINLPPKDWIPQMAIGDDEPQFLFQLPCSWGALYFPWAWREFLTFYRWRKTIQLPSSYVVVPLSATNEWTNSWKRYLVELMYARGLYLLYPSLPRQQSLSTHHREPGEHTNYIPEEHLVEDLGTLILDYFTVPLAKDNSLVHDYLFGRMKSIKEIPVLSFHHERVKDVYELAQLGIWSVEMLRPYPGYSFEHVKNQNCILDAISYPVFNDQQTDPSSASLTNNNTFYPTRIKDDKKYLLYEPQLYISHQVSALENALAYARILNRTLIIPPLVLPNQNLQISMHDILDLHKLNEAQTKASAWAPIKYWDQLSSETIWVDRVVWFKPWNVISLFQSKFDDQFLTNRTIAPLKTVLLPVIRGEDEDIIRLYGGCNDQYLTFRFMLGTFYAHKDTLLDQQFRNWTMSNLVPTATLQKFMTGIRQSNLKGPLGIVSFSRGSNATICGINQKDFMGIKGDLIAYRNCKASIYRTIEYLIEYAKEEKVKLQTIYIMMDTIIQDLNEPIPVNINAPWNGTIAIFSTFQLRKALLTETTISPQLKEYANDVASLLEFNLALEAELYLGNFYLDMSKLITKRRRLMDKTSQVIALGDLNLASMEQQQRLDQ